MISNENLVASFNQNDYQVIFIVGPTGAGKSKLALNLVKKWGGSIVNADSIQFYNSLKIGSASPAIEDLNQANHYLYNYIPDNEVMTAGQFQRDFYKLLKEKKIYEEAYNKLSKKDQKQLAEAIAGHEYYRPTIKSLFTKPEKNT